MEITTHHDGPSWYAVSTRSRQEKLAASVMENLAIEHLLPLFSEERRWSDRKQTVTLPLFPGYVFVRIERSAETQMRVLKIPGIAAFVSNRTGPLPIENSEIENVRAIVARGTGCSPHPYLTSGSRVRIVRGMLAGMEGTLTRAGTQSKLVISVEMIQRSVSVSVDINDVEPAFEARGAQSTIELCSLSAS